MNLETFFHLPESDWIDKFDLSDNDIIDLQNAKAELPNNSFLAEDLISQGFEIIPINTPEYSKTLKNNLKTKLSPPLLYIKGNRQIMQEQCIAIVGSRDADDISMRFTDNIAKNASQQFKVVVSGFARGIDKQALDSALKYKGQSIIVLPQGILTFGSGIQKYYKEITNGDVIVVSTFHPKVNWSAGLAMARNPIIYGFADEIYVAQSSDKGGTWSGVIDGIKKSRIIYVRKPEAGEKNANQILIDKGAKSVNFDGELIDDGTTNGSLSSIIENSQILKDIETDEFEKVLELISKQSFTPKEILEKLKLDMSEKELTKKLKFSSNVECKKIRGKNHFCIKQDGQTLF
jgi:predicted Rossmann fold nucleotide-binding protein DprA/Smf involved in DNA uptake